MTDDLCLEAMVAHHETPDDSGTLQEAVLIPTLRELEAGHIARVLRTVGGNQRLAARILGISRWSLARRLRKYGIHAEP